MESINLGKSGLRVSRLCLGTMTYGSRKWRAWVLDEEESRPFFRKAVEAGFTFFDTADMYSNGMSEAVLGRAIREFTRRDDVVIATKVFFPTGPGVNDRGLGRKHIMQAVEASLRRLTTDYIDLYQIHRFDTHTPIEETMEALHDVVRAGKALYVGASSMFAWQFAKMQHLAGAHGWTRFASMQNHYNLVYREEEREMIPLCIDQGVAVLPWSTLARGFLDSVSVEAKIGLAVHGDGLAAGHREQVLVHHEVRVEEDRFVAGVDGGKDRQEERAEKEQRHKPGSLHNLHTERT